MNELTNRKSLQSQIVIIQMPVELEALVKEHER